MRYGVRQTTLHRFSISSLPAYKACLWQYVSQNITHQRIAQTVWDLYVVASPTGCAAQLRAMPADVDVTQLLIAADQGDEQAVERLLPLVYDELRQIAHRHLYGHQVQTLCTTDVVHEAYVKLFDKSSLPADSRAHFFGAAARAMRQVIVDYARKRNALKRGGNQKPVDLEGVDIALDMQAEEILALNEALERLAHFDERLARMVECRFFGGLSVEETALVLDVSARTVKRDWRRARAWLYRELSSDA